jgi:hypothetical protein
MKIETYTNSPLKTPYAPTWNFSLGSEELPINVENLSKTCLEKEREIKKLPLARKNDGKYTDGFTGLGKNSTTARFSQYNVLEWNTPETNSLKNHAKRCIRYYNDMLGNPTPEHLWVRCWVNILRFGQRINPHMHTVKANSYLSGHFTIQCRNTSTCYINPVNVLNDPEVIENKNHPGEFTIFPSCVPHYTTRHYSFIPRITLAMDFSMLFPFEMEDRRKNWVLL